jgi:hypothetical protein
MVSMATPPPATAAAAAELHPEPLRAAAQPVLHVRAMVGIVIVTVIVIVIVVIIVVSPAVLVQLVNRKSSVLQF